MFKGDIEHPDITRTLKTGYPNLVEQPEHFGTDYFGDEILIDDNYAVDRPNEVNEELILKSNLERYLAEEYRFEFKTAD